MHHSVNKFTLVNYEHRYVLQVAGTPFHDAYELDPDAVKHTKKIILNRQRENDSRGAAVPENTSGLSSFAKA